MGSVPRQYCIVIAYLICSPICNSMKYLPVFHTLYFMLYRVCALKSCNLKYHSLRWLSYLKKVFSLFFFSIFPLAIATVLLKTSFFKLSMFLNVFSVNANFQQ